MVPIHPRLKLLLDFSGLLFELAEAGAKRTRRALRPRRRASYTTRRPGVETPGWNVCVLLLRAELRTPGAQARLARFLGVPRQRVHNFLRARSRLPDAELTLRLLHWLVEKRGGRDLAL